MFYRHLEGIVVLFPLHFHILLQAYDSVWRAGLFAKLQHMGFGGRVLSLITSMYATDRIRFDVNGHLTSPLWLTQGVKQGTPFPFVPLFNFIF